MMKTKKNPPLYICAPEKAKTCPKANCGYLGNGWCCVTTRREWAETVSISVTAPVPCDRDDTWRDDGPPVVEDAGPFWDAYPAQDSGPDNSMDDTPPDDSTDDTPPDDGTPVLTARNPWEPLDMREDGEGIP